MGERPREQMVFMLEDEWEDGRDSTQGAVPGGTHRQSRGTSPACDWWEEQERKISRCQPGGS